MAERRSTIEQADNILRLYRQVLDDFAPELEGRLRESIRKRKLLDTENLVESLKVEVTSQVDSALDEVRINFLSYGRFQDMRNIRTGGRQIPVVASSLAEGSETYNLERWVQARLTKFKYVPGYKNDRRPISEIPNAARRIGFAIAKAKQSSGKKSARKWYTKNVYDAIFSGSGLVANILDAMSEDALRMMASGFDTEHKIM